MELRCDNKLYGVISDGLIEVKCGSVFCGAKPGIVVIHKFHPETGDLVETQRFRDTPTVNNRKEPTNAVGHRTAVRSA